MPLSIWEYIRERTKDAVLAGMQDAMDIVEQGDTNGSSAHAGPRAFVSAHARGEAASECIHEWNAERGGGHELAHQVEHDGRDGGPHKAR